MSANQEAAQPLSWGLCVNTFPAYELLFNSSLIPNYAVEQSPLIVKPRNEKENQGGKRGVEVVL